jgi:protein farnesyltransferase subunit beta
MLDDGLPTATSAAQTALERKVLPSMQDLPEEPEELAEELRLLRDVHVAYLHGALGQLPAAYAALDASRPWICYWALHGLALLEARLPDSPTGDEIVRFLASCQSATGGFGGGPGQVPHLAPTYASVCALLTLGTEPALAAVDRSNMAAFLARMVVPPSRGGGFTVHAGEPGGQAPAIRPLSSSGCPRRPRGLPAWL